MDARLCLLIALLVFMARAPIRTSAEEEVCIKLYNESKDQKKFIKNCYFQSIQSKCKNFCEEKAINGLPGHCKWGDYSNQETLCNAENRDTFCEKCETKEIYKKNCCETCFRECTTTK